MTDRSETREEIDREETSDAAIQSAYERTLSEGRERLLRTWPNLLATGAVGGFDVGIGVFALLVIYHDSGSRVLAALGFSIGFIALILAKSELFTENFLVPIAALVSGDSNVRGVLRLWGGTAAMNLAGGWVIVGLAVAGDPELKDTSVEIGRHLPELGIGWTSLASAILAGAVMTLLTWMERGTRSTGGRLTAAISVGFLLSYGRLNHAVVGALEMFAALHAGAPFSYLDAAGTVAWATLGNALGGVGLVTLLRLIQVGSRARSG